jgi:exodeoxyribonuclease-1
MFDDPRLPELLFRYRARNFPETLTGEERQRWYGFCQQRLSEPQWGAPNTLGDFEKARQQAWEGADEAGRRVLEAWQLHARQLQERYSIG